MLPSTAKTPYSMYITARCCEKRVVQTRGQLGESPNPAPPNLEHLPILEQPSSPPPQNPGHPGAFKPIPPHPCLTCGTVMEQILPKRTCPERAKMMTFLNEVNHITHSKSATSCGSSTGRLTVPSHCTPAPTPVWRGNHTTFKAFSSHFPPKGSRAL